MMDKRNVLVGVLVVCLCIGTSTSFTGCSGNGGTITPVLEWVVGFATDIGEWVTAKASNFAAAVAKAWSAFLGTDLVNNVKPDSNDPLIGTYEGILRCEVEWGKASEDNGKLGNRLEITLDHPKMFRRSEDSSEWGLAKREQDRIHELQKQLLSAG